VEIGTHIGKTVYRGLKHLPETRFVCVDPWESSPELPAIYGNMEEVFKEFLLIMTPWLGTRLFPIRARSADAAEWWPPRLPRVAACGPWIDFLWIDGDHTEEAVYEDLRLWVPKVRVGGVVVGDNWEMASVKRGVKWFFEDVRRYSREHVLSGPAVGRLNAPEKWIFNQKRDQFRFHILPPQVEQGNYPGQYWNKESWEGLKGEYDGDYEWTFKVLREVT
jgi:hypothetical protein